MTYAHSASPAPLGQPKTVASSACLIIHPNTLVAFDLRDILEAEGATEVLTFTELSQAPLEPARLVILSTAPGILETSTHGAFWKFSETPVIMLNSGRMQPIADPAWVHFMDEPFCTEDVTALLHGLQIF
ncbi:hypothetical protein [Gymnodinialimonas sp. 57CJ19]|uniref:hypothetical protein n=1 Tax=Gymnodinialimonas sp. 57CJ19 TaxID=3138498 RepID=UPI00313455CF